MKLVIIILFSLSHGICNGSNEMELIKQKWIYEELTFKSNTGWKTVSDQRHILDFRSFDCCFLDKSLINNDTLIKKEYEIRDREIWLKDGTLHSTILDLSNNALSLDYGNFIIHYKAIKDNLIPLAEESIKFLIVNNLWQFHPNGHEILKFTNEKIDMYGFETNMNRMKEGNHFGGWILKRFQGSYFLTILSPSTLNFQTYQLMKVSQGFLYLKDPLEDSQIIIQRLSND